MKGPSTLVLCRHARSVMNDVKNDGPFVPEDAHERVAHIRNDRETPLAENGHSQARQEGVRLRDQLRSFDVAYHSDTVRGRDTASDLILAFHHTREIPLRESFLLNERDPGYTFGLTQKEARQQFPSLNEYWERAGWFYARPLGGESVQDVATNRVLPYLRMLDEEHEGGRILVVTHGRWIQAARIIIERLPTEPEVPHGRNCGWIEYHRSWKTERLELYSDRFWTNAP